MRSKGINGGQAKKENRLLVLRLLCTMREATRTEITRQVGLVKMTVSNITTELLENRVIYERERLVSAHSGAGRRQVLLAISPETPAVAGIWISNGFCLGMVTAMDLQVLSQRMVNLSPEETAASLIGKVQELVRVLQSTSGRRLIGVGIADSLEPETEVREESARFPGKWRQSLTEGMGQQLGCPVYLQKDANAGALAEQYFGCCRDCQTFVYVGLADKITAGLVVQGALHTGREGLAGKIGHMVVDFHGTVCGCGRRGCLEAFVSVPKILGCFSSLLGKQIDTLGEVCGFCEGSAAGRELLDRLLGILAMGLANLGNLLAPEIIVIGDEGAVLGDEQLSQIESQVNAGLFLRGAAPIRVVRSSFGTLAPAYGAAVAVLQRVFDGELLYEELFAQ